MKKSYIYPPQAKGENRETPLTQMPCRQGISAFYSRMNLALILPKQGVKIEHMIHCDSQHRS
jgi:hypothetical protein